MNILILNDFSEQIGGTERYVNSLKSGFETKKHKVRVFTGNTTYVDSLKKKTIPRLFSLLFNVKYLIQISNLINQTKPDVIIANNIFYELSPSFLAFTHGVPIIMVVHDSQIYAPMALQHLRTGKKCRQTICEGCTNCMGFLKSRLERFKRRFHRLLLRNIDVYVGNSNFVNQVIKKRGIGKTASFNYGITLLPFTKLKNLNDISYIGRLVEEKGVQDLIRAMPKILSFNPNAILNITGQGDYKTKLVRMVEELKLKDKVFFHTGKKHDNIYPTFQKSGVVVIPSIWDEPFCQVGLEAMSVGRPVVASNVGGIKDWLFDGKTGFFVEPNRPEQIAQRVIDLMSNHQLMLRMSNNATKAAEAYKIERHIDNMELLCLDLVNEYRTRRKAN